MQWQLYDKVVIGKGSNDEIVSILDTSVKSSALLSRINTVFISRQDTRFKSGYSGALFSKTNSALVSKLDARVRSEFYRCIACVLFSTTNIAFISRRDARFKSGFSGPLFLRIDTALVSRLNFRDKSDFTSESVSRWHFNWKLHVFLNNFKRRSKREIVVYVQNIDMKKT